jgi:hypothetical protein
MSWVAGQPCVGERGREQRHRKLRSELQPHDRKRKHCISARKYLEGEDWLLGSSLDNDEEIEENSSQSEKCRNRWMGPWQRDAAQLDGN